MENYEIIDTGKTIYNEPYILLKDTDTGKTITNSAEAVIKDLCTYLDIKGRHIYYIDTDGAIDELLHNGVKFVGFKGGNDIGHFTH